MKNIIKKQSFLIVIVFLLIVISACNSQETEGEDSSGGDSQIDFPDKPIDFIVPFESGGGMDTVARGLAESSSDYMGESLTVVNKEGAGGTIGITEGSQENPDGYTVILSPSAAFTAQPYMREVAYDMNDFDLLTSIVHKPNVLVVNKDSPYDSLEDLIKDRKENGEELKVGHTGEGTPGYLAQETLFNDLDVKFEGVPYKGNNPNITALMGGHIDASIAYSDEVLQQVKDDELKILGVFEPEKFEEDKDLAEVPTIGEEVEEAGYEYNYSDVSFSTTLFVMVPEGTPEEIRDFLEDNFKEMVQDDDFLEFAENADIPIKTQDSEELQEDLEKEKSVFGPLIEDLGISE